MLTVLNSIELSAEYLANKGVESARLNAELLLSNILKCKRMDLYLRFDQPLSQKETEEYRQAIKRRGLREPLQYIIGNVEFYGLNFNINPSVLIPRNETEILVETVIEHSKELIDLRILDIGTGSGNIIISLIKNLDNATGVGIDISREAIEVGKDNARLNDVAEKIEFIQKNVLNDNLQNLGEFDIIVSNPPYVNKYEYKTLQKEIVEHEPEIALTDYADGLTFYNLIIKNLSSLLKENGKMYFELGKEQAEEVNNIFKDNGFGNINIVKDYSDISRVIYGEKF